MGQKKLKKHTKKKSKSTHSVGFESTSQVTFRSAKIARDSAGRGHAHLSPQCAGKGSLDYSMWSLDVRPSELWSRHKVLTVRKDLTVC